MIATIPASNVYRGKVAAAAATGGSLPFPATIAVGNGTMPPSPDDTGLENELYRKSITNATASGTIMTISASITGDECDQTMTEFAVFDADGELMGRRTFAPKTLEEESELKFTINFQF